MCLPFMAHWTFTGVPQPIIVYQRRGSLRRRFRGRVLPHPQEGTSATTSPSYGPSIPGLASSLRPEEAKDSAEAQQWEAAPHLDAYDSYQRIA